MVRHSKFVIFLSTCLAMLLASQAEAQLFKRLRGGSERGRCSVTTNCRNAQVATCPPVVTCPPISVCPPSYRFPPQQPVLPVPVPRPTYCYFIQCGIAGFMQPCYESTPELCMDKLRNQYPNCEIYQVADFWCSILEFKVATTPCVPCCVNPCGCP